MTNSDEIHVERNRIEHDINDIKETVKRIEQSLTGSIVNGETTIGVFENIRILKGDIAILQNDYKQVNELNKSIEQLYRWKYIIVGGFLVGMFFVERLIEWTITLFKGSKS